MRRQLPPGAAAAQRNIVFARAAACHGFRSSPPLAVAGVFIAIRRRIEPLHLDCESLAEASNGLNLHQQYEEIAQVLPSLCLEPSSREQTTPPCRLPSLAANGVATHLRTPPTAREGARTARESPAPGALTKYPGTAVAKCGGRPGSTAGAITGPKANCRHNPGVMGHNAEVPALFVKGLTSAAGVALLKVSPK